jgi:RNA polymerase sigma factor (sigma-70 family)
MTKAQQDLAARYVPFARALAKPLRDAYPRVWADLQSAALLALVQAAVTYDPQRNIPFPTYARHRIWGALREVNHGIGVKVWQRRRKQKNPAYLVRLAPTSEERGLVMNTRVDPPVGEDIEAIEEVERWLRRLPSKHAKACRQIYLQGKPQWEVAAMLGCSRSRLSALHREALTMLGRSFPSLRPPPDAITA